MIDLRPYQTDLIAQIRAAFTRNRRVLAVAPTGAGKTVMFTHMVGGATSKGNSTIIAAHRQEICDQISASLTRFGVYHGVIQSGRAMVPAHCHVAMIQTLARRIEKITPPRFLVVDEAHHSASETYSRLINAWSATKVLGVTATPERLDGKGLHRWYDEMVIGPATGELIEAGFLSKFRYLRPPSSVDLSKARVSMGDFNISDLEEAVTKAACVGDVVTHYAKYLDGRPAIAFCVTVNHAQIVAEAFRAAGFHAASVDGKMDPAERRDVLASIGDGRLNVLTSCELISEGVDIPVVSGAILIRPTKSLSMFLQQCGRVLRIKPDGSDAVILDHVNNCREHGTPDAERVWLLEDRARKPAPARTCEICYRVFDVKAPRVCDGIPVDPVPRGATCEPGALWSPIGCVWQPEPLAAGATREAPTEVEGDLEEVTHVPAWSRGIDIKNAPFKEVIKVARTRAQLEEVAHVRGYSMGWVDRIISARETAKTRAIAASYANRGNPARHSYG